ASTADHTGPLTHPFFVNSNLLTAASLKTHADPALENVIVLSCANISLNNSSLPRGILYHSAQKDMPMRRCSFFPSSIRPQNVYTLKPFGPSDIKKIYSNLDKELKEK